MKPRPKPKGYPRRRLSGTKEWKRALSEAKPFFGPVPKLKKKPATRPNGSFGSTE
jgi:hypothetical protein